jgi:hypothetical protein
MTAPAVSEYRICTGRTRTSGRSTRLSAEDMTPEAQ